MIPRTGPQWEAIDLPTLLLPPANEVWGKVMFLHLSVCSWGEGFCIQGGLHPWGSASKCVCIGGKGVRQTPLQQNTTRYGQQAGGTHPTGMLSFYCYRPQL